MARCTEQRQMDPYDIQLACSKLFISGNKFADIADNEKENRLGEYHLLLSNIITKPHTIVYQSFFHFIRVSTPVLYCLGFIWHNISK